MPCSAALLQCSTRTRLAAGEGVRPGGDVARPDDLRVADGRAVDVADEPLGDVQPRALEPADVRQRAERDERGLRLDGRAVGQHHAREPARAVGLEAVHAAPEDELDAVVELQRGAGRAELGPEHRHRGGRDVAEDDLDPAGPRGGGHLAADEARARR